MRKSYVNGMLIAAATLSKDRVSSALEQTNTSFHPDITKEWYADNNCSFYQSYVDTVFLCNEVEVYVLPRERSFEELTTLTNIYDPAAFGFNGQIKRVFT